MKIINSLLTAMGMLGIVSILVNLVIVISSGMLLKEDISFSFLIVIFLLGMLYLMVKLVRYTLNK